MQRIRIAYLILAGFFWNGEARACKFAMPKTEIERQAAAEETVRRATAIIDAEVIKPYVSETNPALLRARRVFKGPVGQRVFAVAGPTSCHIQFRQKGLRMRVLLFDGPRPYQASVYPSAREDIDRAIARLLRR